MRSYSHLSDDEREQIGLAALGHSIGGIAQAIGRPKSTISRELSRNRLPSGRYSPLHAAGAYQLRRRREAMIERDRGLRTFVLDRLAEGSTPEQISGWLKGGNERRLRAVSCETILLFIYRAAQRAEQLWRYPFFFFTRRHKSSPATPGPENLLLFFFFFFPFFFFFFFIIRCQCRSRRLPRTGLYPPKLGIASQTGSGKLFFVRSRTQTGSDAMVRVRRLS